MPGEGLDEILKRLGGEIIEFDTPVKTVEQAARVSGADPGRIIKSILLITERAGPVLAIVDGRSRVDLKKIEEKLGRTRLATPREVKEITGYEVGELPPIGVPVKTLVDEGVLEKEQVLGGGGAINRLIRINPRRIVEVQKAEVARISIQRPAGKL